jgi:hypothetical protein
MLDDDGDFLRQEPLDSIAATMRETVKQMLLATILA